MVGPSLATSRIGGTSLSSEQGSVLRGGNGAVIVFIALFAAALAPVLWFAIPAAMVDYPNHLTRMFILSGSGGPHQNPFYQVTWAFYPDLAMDLLVPPFARLVGVETATRLFFLAGQILVVTGAMGIERVVKGRIAIAGFVALMFLYSLPFAWGFVNFEFALGCALWGIAAAIAAAERGWITRLALHSVFIAWLFVAHMFALGLYGFTVGVHELWRARLLRAAPRDLLARLGVLALPALVLAGIMITAGGQVGGSGTAWLLDFKPLWLVLIMNGYSLTASAAAVFALVVLVRTLARQGALRFVNSGAWLAAAFALLYAAMPSRLFDTSFVDLRVIVAAAFILPGFVSVTFASVAQRRMALAGAAAIILLNVAVVLTVWTSYRVDYAAARQTFRMLPKHAKILIADSRAGDDPPLGHLIDYPMYQVPTLAVHYADAFVPNLFTARGKQPVTVRAPWRRLDIPYGGPVPIAMLKTIVETGAPKGTPAFIRTWSRDFDYLYLLGQPAANPMPDLLEPVLTASDFVFYRIRKSGGDADRQ